MTIRTISYTEAMRLQNDMGLRLGIPTITEVHRVLYGNGKNDRGEVVKVSSIGGNDWHYRIIETGRR